MEKIYKRKASSSQMYWKLKETSYLENHHRNYGDKIKRYNEYEKTKRKNKKR